MRKSCLRLLLVLVATFSQVHATESTQTNTANPKVDLKTNYGVISIELYPEQAPITVANFLQYVDDRFYDGLIFHRVIPHFMIQGGRVRCQFKGTAHPVAD